MQEDYTVFKIPNQPKKASTFEVVGKEKLKVDGVTMGQISYETVNNAFPLWDELNNIAEELEKCRLRNS